MFTEILRGLRGLKGLRGLEGLSQQERDAWRRVNASKLEGKSAQYEDRLYANQQFVKKFGMDAFNSFNKDQRDYIYKNTIVNELYTDLYSPYTDKVGTDGKYIVDPNKGMGSEAEFKKYYAMDADSKLELIRSGWKPTPQIESELKKERDMKLATISNSNAWVGAPNYAQGAVTASFIFREPIHEELSRSENNKILEGIYARDLKKREEELQPEIDDYYLNTIGKLSDSEVKSQFMKALTPSDTNIGNSQLLAFFHDGKNVEDEVKNFSIDDMRMYLAKFKVLNDRLGADAAYTALYNYAKEYISDHQGKLTYAGLLAKDIGIGILSYTADKVNGMRQLLNTGKKSVVWIDNKGNVVAPDQVRTAKNGDKYYINDDGKVTAIKQTKMSVTDLDYLGKDAEGNTRSDFLNNQFWADAEQYGTLDSNEIKQYKKLGASPYKVVYKPGDDSDLLYETIKMTSFAIADAASMLIPGYGETVGAAMQTTKAASLLGKAISTLGKGIYYTSKLAKAAQPTISATAIGHAYGRGVFGEALTQNMQQLEEYAYTFAQKNFHDNYNSNKQFKDQVDKDVQTEFNKLKNIQKAELNTSEGNKEIANQGLTDEALMEKAKQIVSSTYIDRGVKDIQNSDDYFDMVGKASESASDAAMTAAITDGAKYILVNNFGYRKFLFNTAADRAASSARRLARNLSEKESRRLLFKSLIDGKKLKTIGKITASQAWGGAWTNFTDEMQSWGGKQINQDRFSSYLSGFYNGQASDDIYGAIDAVTSYFNGAMASLAKGTTWKAGLVGATGSLTSFAPNVASIATTIGTKRGREAWRKASLGEKVNMIFNNGVLNEYYGKKQGESEIKRYVDIVNKLLDEQDNFSILKSAVALDRASIDVSNQEDKNAITYLKAVNAISLLHQFQSDSGIKDQSSSRIKRWLKNKFGEGENTLGAVANQSTILTKALSEIEDLANGNLSEESAKNYLSEYYAKNPTVEQSEDNNKRALEEISQNAKTLIEAENTWQDINSKLDMVEKDRGSKISSNVRSRLLERAALDGFLSERLDALEDKISGNRINTSTESTAETWGTKEAIKKQVLSMERTERDLNKDIIATKNRLDSATTKLNEYKKTHDIENLDDIATTEYIGLLNNVEAAKLQYEYTVNSMDKLKSRQEKMKAMSKEESSRVLSKDEILALPSEARARMLNDLNRSNYSKEQLEQIDALKNELTLKDPSLLQSIQDQARLLKQKNANASAYEMMLENPEAAYTEFEAQDGVDATISRDLFFRRYSESINNVIRKLSSLSNIKDVSQDDIREAIYKNLRVLHPKILDYLDTTLPNEKGLEFIPLYSNEIVKAKEWSNMLTDISKAVDQMNFDDSTKKAFSDNIGNLIDKASTRKQAMDILEQVSNSTNVSNSDQANFRKLLNIINGVEEQRNATTTETKEEKKARQESQETQAKQEEKKVQDAEDKVKSHARKLYDKYLQQLNEANTPIEKLTAINSLLQTNEKASKLGKELLQKEELDKIQKIQETLKEEGYEITPLLGTQYDDGMKVIVEFVPGKLGQKNNEIVSVSTPQILKDGKLVQAAKIVVATQVIEQAPEVGNRTLRSSFKEVGLESNESATGRIQNDNGGNLTSIQAKIIRTKALTVFENAQDSDNQRLHDAIVSAAHGIIANASVLALLYKALDAVKKGRMSVREAMALLETYMDVDDDTHKSLMANLDKTIEEIEQSLQRKSQSQKEKNIQETYQETEREKSNEKNAQETYTETEQERRNQEEANRQLHTYEQTDEDIARDKAIEEQRKEGVDFSSGTIDFESPNWEKQVEQAEAEGHKIEEGFVSKGTVDTTDQGNNFTSTSENMLGNTMYGYDVKALEEDAKEVERTGRNPNDKMSRFFNWFKTANIKLQEIIDNELRDIIKANSKLEILYVNPQANATDDAALNDFSLLSVEYTDAVKKVHNEDRGGVITAGGKQYLIVGTMGFDRNNSAQGDTYRSILYQGKKNRYKYFTENPSERFYVDPSGHTEVEQITSGRIVREMLGDTETKIRPITELLSDSNRNPKGLKLQDLKWGIMFEDGLHYANVSPRNTVYPPRDTLSNLGAVFLLIEATNGNYIPVAIRPTMLSDLQDGALKTQLNNLFNELSSTKHSDRLGAINQLVKLLNIKEEGDNILVGMKDKATVSTVKNGTVLRTFNLKDANFSRMDLINAIFELNPRVNITLSTLSDPVQLKMYAEAGALNTDIAKLGTSNASYTVYSMDANGNPIKTKPIENRDPSTEANSDLNKADYKKKHSVYYRGSQYREKNGKWYNTNWKEVTDPILLSQIKWTSYIRVNDLTPNLVGNDMFGNKNNKYYIINSNPTNAKVIKVLSNGIVAELNINDSRVIIEKVQNRDIQAAREKAAKEEKERLMHIENSMDYNNTEETGEGEDVTEVNEISGANLTEEQIVAQGNGDFQLDSKPQKTDTELKAQAMVDRITTDTHSITLDSKRGIYTDSTGKEYARVTSVIQATKDAERFDPNSPWVVPSTNIGTGVDNFVRDFFANKLGNVDNLNERYPNADITQLKSFLKQLEGLKEKFDKAGLTVVPRDVTVTGEVEVTDTNGKKYKLAVAGTLDLLAYDKEGNFYIFDMKTNRSVPDEKKVTKWDKQLSLYKQFLETKYGISVKGTSIIPIEVKYPIPKGWRNGKTVYRADEKTNQLYYQTEDNSGALTSSTPYRDAKPILHPNIPISTSPVKIEYNLLTDSEKALLSPVVDGTFNSSTGTTNIESKNKNKDINKTGDISLAELQASTNAKPTDVSSMLKNRNYSKKVRGILKEKGFNGKMSEVEAWLKEHNMPISNIKDIDSWIDMLQNCR